MGRLAQTLGVIGAPLNTPALDKLLAKGQYKLHVIGWEIQASLTGETSPPVARTELKLAIKPEIYFPGARIRKLYVRIVGPVTLFDKTEDGETVIGAFRIDTEEYEVVIMATEVFLTHCLISLSALPQSRCFLTLRTKTKVEQSAEGYVFLLEAALSTTSP